MARIAGQDSRTRTHTHAQTHTHTHTGTRLRRTALEFAQSRGRGFVESFEMHERVVDVA